MGKYEKVTDDELVSYVFAGIANADYETTSEISEQRSEADLAYTGEFTRGTEPNSGMSSIIVNAYQPAVDTLTTYISNAVTEKRQAVVFEVEDEAMAKEAADVTKILNDCVYKHNDGYTVINRWIKDAFLHKTALVSTTWDTTQEYFKFEFEGAEPELAIEMAKKESEGWDCVVMEKHKYTETIEISDDDTGETLEVSSDFVKAVVKCSRNKDKPIIANIPPEEFLINEGAVSLDRDDPTFNFCCRRQERTLSDIQELLDSDDRFDQSIDVEDLGATSVGYLQDEQERATRHAFDGTYFVGEESSSQGLLRQADVIEFWIRSDRDGDGIAEWRHGFLFGSKLALDEEHFGAIPIHAFTPFPIPHKFYGLGLWAKLRDYHRTKTGLVRAAIDSANHKNLVRFFGDPRKIDQRALKSGKPGLIPVMGGTLELGKDLVEVPKPSGSAGESLSLLEYLDREILAQIGIDPKTGVVSADIEKSGNDAAKTAQTIDNASTKIEALVRELAETGMRSMVWAIYDLYMQYDVLPDVGLSKSDLMAKVGTGYQTQQQKVAGAQAIIQQQAALEASPVAPVPIPYGYKQEAALELTRALGFEDASRFFPPTQEVEQERQRQEQLAAQQAQAQQQAVQAQQQDQFANSEQKRKLEEAKAQEAIVKAEGAQRKQQLDEEAKVMEIENLKHDNDLNIRRQEAQEEQMAANLEMQQENLRLQKEIAELKARTELEKARIADEKTVNINKE